LSSFAFRVFVENREIWEDDIRPDEAELDLPVGIRPANARLEFDFYRSQIGSNRRLGPCKSGDFD
jgi:hypothetical protein